MSSHAVPQGVMDALEEAWGRLAASDAGSVSVLRSETGWSAMLVARDSIGRSGVVVRRREPLGGSAS